MCAAMSDQLDVVKLLLSRGAAYAAQDVCEQTCLHFAALNVCSSSYSAHNNDYLHREVIVV